MKIQALISLFFLCFVLISCSDDEEVQGCVTAFDCPDGYSCIDSLCQPQGSEITDADNQDPADGSGNSDPTDSTSSELPGNNDSDTGDSSLPGENDGDVEIPDDIQGCPNGCSDFGECDFSTGKCTCDATHQGEDCSECKEGFHLEAVDDDENGDGKVSCAPNLTCNPNPCNNNGCREEGDTVVCTCTQTNHQSGRWCEMCAEGYIKSNVDGKCKEDCSLMTCTAPKKCGIDYTTNEAGCNACDNEYYTGTDCKSCDTVHFCNGHATACVVEGGTEKCTCEAAYTGSACNTCASGYFQSNGLCVKNCEANKCFKTYQCTGTSVFGFETSATVSGHGTCNNTTGECMCDAGWLTAGSGSGETVDCGLLTILETLDNVECTICDKNNPPSQYVGTGCPQSLTEDTSLCSSVLSTFCGPYGSCYYEATGSHQLYCVCSDGYHLDNGDKYTGSCMADSSD
jgi:hypothetical protein